MIRSILCFGLALSVGIVVGNGNVRAHDVPDRSFDREIQLTLHADRIDVSYHLSLTQLTLAEELLALAGPGGLSGYDPADRLEVYASKMGPLLAEGLILRLDGIERAGKFISARPRIEDHVRIAFQIAVSFERADQERAVTIEDTSFFLEKGRVALAIRSGAGVELVHSTVPAELSATVSRAAWEMTPEEQDASRRADATFQPRLTTDSKAAMEPRRDLVAADPAIESPPQGSGNSGLLDLLDRRSSHLHVVLLAIAFFFGAAHAMTPGHGKTMVAAYLIGERGTLRHAVGLGLTTSLTHTGSVLAVAFVLALAAPALEQRMNTGLSLVSGVMVAGLGLWLLIARLRSPVLDRRANDDQSNAPAKCDGLSPSGPTWPGMMALGVSGGMVPCWDAVALLLFAAAEGELTRAISLLISFSAGLAAALVSVGILAVRLRGFLAGRMGSGGIVRALPVVSAAAILAVGLYLCMLTLKGSDEAVVNRDTAVSAAEGVRRQ